MSNYRDDEFRDSTLDEYAEGYIKESRTLGSKVKAKVKEWYPDFLISVNYYKVGERYEVHVSVETSKYELINYILLMPQRTVSKRFKKKTDFARRITMMTDEELEYFDTIDFTLNKLQQEKAKQSISDWV